MSDTNLTLEQLAARIERQEQSMKGRWIGLSLLVAVCFLGTLYALRSGRPSSSDTVTAKTLSVETVALRNANGDVVAMLSSTTDGTPHISLVDAQKKVRLSIGLRADGTPTVAFLDPEQVARAVLSLGDQQDEPSLVMFDAAKLPRAAVAIDTAGSGHVVLSGPAGGLSLSASDGRLEWNPAGGTSQDIKPQK